MSSTQLATSGPVLHRAPLTTFMNAAGGILKPNPALLISHKRLSESRTTVWH